MPDKDGQVTTNKVAIEYVERDIQEIKDKLVSKDLVKAQHKQIMGVLSNIQKQTTKTNGRVTALEEHKPMLEDMKEERSDKRKIRLEYAWKAVVGAGIIVFTLSNAGTLIDIFL